MSFTEYSQTDYKSLVIPGSEKFKSITVVSGEAAASRGQVVVLRKSDSKYKLLGSFTAKATTPTPTIADNDVQIFAGLASTPILPGSVIITCTISGSLATFTDNASGILAPTGSGVGQGIIDYDTGEFSIQVNGVFLSSDSIGASHTCIGSTGDGLDLSQLAVLVEAVDASSADKRTRGLVGGQIVAGNLTPTVTISNKDQYRLFQRAGLILQEDTDALTQ